MIKKITPSNIKQHTECVGSFALSYDIPYPPSSPQALSGTETSLLLEKTLPLYFDKSFNILKPDFKDTAGTEITEDSRLLRVLEVVDFLKNWRNEVLEVYPEAQFIYFAQEINLNCFKLANGYLIGKPDIVIAWSCSNLINISVFDLKDGQTPVYADNNPQLLCYSAGLINQLMYEFNYPLNKFNFIHNTILQPRINNYSSTVLQLEELKEKIKELKSKAEESYSLVDKPLEIVYQKLSPSESACKYCLAKTRCPAILDVNKDVLLPVVNDNKIVSAPVFIDSLSKAQKINILKYSKILEEVIEIVKKDIKSKMLAGEEFEDFKLVKSRSDIDTWNSDVSYRVLGLKELGVEAFKQTEKTCTEIKQEVKKLKKEQEFNDLNLISKKSFGIAVALKNDKRKEIAFEDINLENDFDIIEE